MASSTWCGKRTAWCPETRGRRNSRVRETWSPTGSARSAATSIPRPISAAASDRIRMTGGRRATAALRTAQGLPTGVTIDMARWHERFAALFGAFALLLAAGAPASAQRYEEALGKFTTDSYADTDAGITGVAASGNPLAASVIEALQDGRLLFSADDKAVFIRE